MRNEEVILFLLLFSFTSSAKAAPKNEGHAGVFFISTQKNSQGIPLALDFNAFDLEKKTKLTLFSIPPGGQNFASGLISGLLGWDLANQHVFYLTGDTVYQADWKINGPVMKLFQIPQSLNDPKDFSFALLLDSKSNRWALSKIARESETQTATSGMADVTYSVTLLERDAATDRWNFIASTKTYGCETDSADVCGKEIQGYIHGGLKRKPRSIGRNIPIPDSEVLETRTFLNYRLKTKYSRNVYLEADFSKDEGMNEGEGPVVFRGPMKLLNTMRNFKKEYFPPQPTLVYMLGESAIQEYDKHLFFDVEGIKVINMETGDIEFEKAQESGQPAIFPATFIKIPVNNERH